ncbi:hypothetical protein DY052_06000 [Apilactobacillus timberlakei]|uniref:hypothetical protein n=1 Tax=Apilactobacillus timberlakei TaxID=2008380 RepID=UPI0011275A4D|nr:hypothetical protein [Apilactobacillus timberlakei]TPR14976.1 hypothetical protein DY052_06000 [Apilactobacillus timberlakei]
MKGIIMPVTATSNLSPEDPFSSTGNGLYTIFEKGQPVLYISCALAALIGLLICLVPSWRKIGKTTIIIAASVAFADTLILGGVAFFRALKDNSDQNVFTIYPPLLSSNFNLLGLLH